MVFDAVAGFMKGTVQPILDKFIPDAQQRVEAEQLLFKSLLASDLAQVELNKVEAQHADLFVSGWRPFIGWICGASLAYAVIGYSFLNWALIAINPYTAHEIGQLPAPDTTITLEILMALLGLGGLRTYEKIKGVK